jgi:hypothetical protein
MMANNDSEEELNYVVYPPKNFFVETACFLGSLSFMELENLYDEEYNSHPLISVVREIVQSEPSIPLSFITDVIYKLTQVITYAYASSKAKSYTLQFFHDRKKLVREYLSKSNDELMTEDWFERDVDKTFLIEICWAFNFDDRFYYPLYRNSIKEEKKEMLKKFGEYLIEAMIDETEQLIYSKVKNVVRKLLREELQGDKENIKNFKPFANLPSKCDQKIPLKGTSSSLPKIAHRERQHK